LVCLKPLVWWAVDISFAYDNRTTAAPSLRAAWELKIDASRFRRVCDQRSGIDLSNSI
jgi:hypothetical protein